MFSAGAVLVAGAVFVSAAGAASAGAAGAGSADVVDKTETPPCNAGIEIKSASTIKQDAATIVIFESTEAVPRGPNAALEMLLVKRAPASVLPG